MKQFFYLSAICLVALASCKPDYKKADQGIEYKIVADGSGNKVAYGNYIQMQIRQMYKNNNKDTTMVDSRDLMPRIESFDSLSYPAPYFKIFAEARKGDSIVLRMSTDSLMKTSPQGLPPFIQKGGYLYTTIKVVNIFTTKEMADSANAAEMKIAKPKIYKKQMEEVQKQLDANKSQIEIDGKTIADYLAKNNITATKGAWGTYVSIQEPGTGDNIDKNTVVTVNYTGRTLDSGKVFDSNVDPKFKHVQPYQINMGQLGGIILGWIDGLVQLKKGAKATFYIPSSLGYGKGGNPQGGINPNANLVFDINIVDVVSEEEFAKQAAEIRTNIEQIKKEAGDSMSRPVHSNK